MSNLIALLDIKQLIKYSNKDSFMLSVGVGGYLHLKTPFILIQNAVGVSLLDSHKGTGMSLFCRENLRSRG